MFQHGGFGPIPGQVHHFLALDNEADRRYGLARYSKETRRLYGVMDQRPGAAVRCSAPSAIVGRNW